MNTQPSLDRMRTDLLRHGLPNDYVERVIGELSDHEEDAATVARRTHLDGPPCECAAGSLGSTAALTRCVLSEYRARYFAGRHRWLVFLVAPVPMLLFAWAVYMFSVFSGGSLLLSDETLGENVWLLRVVDGLLVFGVPLAVAAGFCRLAARSCVGLRWAAASTALVGLTAFALRTQLTPPVGGPGTGSYMIGLGIGPLGLPLVTDWTQPLQALVPCLVLAAFALRHLRTHHVAFTA